MRQLRLVRVFAAVAIAVAATAAAGAARACSCMEAPWPGTAMLEADAVFVGRVFSQRPVQRTDGAQVTFAREVVFEVQHAWKGATSFARVLAQPASDGCGFSFENGGAYLVYAFRGPTDLWTGRCTRTTERAAGGIDFLLLGLPALSYETRLTSAPYLLSVAGVFGQLLLVGVHLAFAARWYEQWRARRRRARRRA